MLFTIGVLLHHSARLRQGIAGIDRRTQLVLHPFEHALGSAPVCQVLADESARGDDIDVDILQTRSLGHLVIDVQRRKEIPGGKGHGNNVNTADAVRHDWKLIARLDLVPASGLKHLRLPLLISLSDLAARFVLKYCQYLPACRQTVLVTVRVLGGKKVPRTHPGRLEG